VLREGVARRSFDAISTRIAGELLRRASQVVARRKLDLRVEGRSNVPENGPVLLAARHFHHLYDGVVLMSSLPRPLHILVALDWVDSQRLRRLMEWATRTAAWPSVLREEGLTPDEHGVIPHPDSAFHRDEVERYRLRSIRDSVRFLLLPLGGFGLMLDTTDDRAQCVGGCDPMRVGHVVLQLLMFGGIIRPLSVRR
jgi:putative membrane protein